MGRSDGYNTKQRETIIVFIMDNAHAHVTVNDIITHLNAQGTPVGVTTVYRQLDKLVRQGIVRKYIVDESRSACYQYVRQNAHCHEHFHLKCLECGKLIHLDCDFLDDMDTHILSEHHFHVDSSKTVLYGQCEGCAPSSEYA